MSSTEVTQNQSLFFQLPQEIRDHVYDDYLADLFESETHFKYFPREFFMNETRRYTVPVLTVCRRVYREIKEYMQKPRSLNYIICPRGHGFDRVAAFGFQIRKRNANLESTPNIVLQIWPPLHNQNAVIKIWRIVTEALSKFASKKLNSVTVHFMESKIAAWSKKHQPLVLSKTNKMKAPSTIDIMIRVLALHLHEVNRVRVCLPTDLDGEVQGLKIISDLERFGGQVPSTRRKEVTDRCQEVEEIFREMRRSQVSYQQYFAVLRADPADECACYHSSWMRLSCLSKLEVRRFPPEWIRDCCEEPMTQAKREEHFKRYTSLSLSDSKSFCKVEKVEGDQWVGEADDLGTASLFANDQ